MIEVYVLLTLAAVGYLLNKTNNDVKKTNTNIIHQNEMPSMKNIYESTHYNDTDMILKQKADRKFQASLNPGKTNVISYNHGLIMDNLKEDQEEEKILSLSGEYINKENFTHKNMVPFYGGSIKQNMDDKANRNLLETFTGVNDLQKNKCETASFYDLTKDMGNINGSQDASDFYKDRMVAPTLRAHEFPIPQIQVGPGIGQGYTSTPSGGYQQFEAQDYAKSKCVDQLRTKLNPNKNAIGMVDVSKETYAGRTVDGLKTGLRGKMGKMNKNRVDTSYEQTEGMWLKTTGANLKPTKHGEWNVKETNRMTTTRQQLGTAFASSQLARTGDPKVKRTSRQQLKGNYLGVGSMDKYGVGNKYDYGKSQILVYNNERDVTSTKVYQGNVTSLIKAIIAPLEDMIKVTKKQHTVDNPRHFGNMKIQIPSKQTVYDPNDVAKATIKETTIHEYILGNLKGNEKLTIYDPNDVARATTKETTVHEYLLGNLKGNEKLTIHDPNDVARTTIKETTVHDYILGNLKGNEKITIYDPNDVARTTTKETTIHEYLLGNLKGSEKQTIYDPNDVARTTIKETLIHDEIGTGTITGAKQLYVYDPEDVAKKTIRETVERDDYELNMSSRVYKGKIYDPEDIARRTTKETTVDLEREFGNIDRWARGGAYESTEYDAKDTQKQFLSDYDYYGGAMRDGGEGYVTNEYDAKDTQKQFLSDYEYYGGAAGVEDKKQMSYDDMFNATITERKEVLLFDREPTQSGNKVFNDCMNVAVPRKNECDIRTERENLNHTHITNEIPTSSDYTVTKMRKNTIYEADDRFDVSLLDAFKDNPYRIDITKPF
jgi:hypothetical protein